MSHDAVVLAGGAGRRMGGALKAQVELRGRRLLDHVLDATAQARSVVVVAPPTVPVPQGVTRTLEDPPLGGPVAGVAAGLAALDSPAPWVLLLACDVPGAAAGVPRLVRAAAELTPTPPPAPTPTPTRAESGVVVATPDVVPTPTRAESGVVVPAPDVVPTPTRTPTRAESGVVVRAAGVVLRDGEGRDQWLLGVYRSDVLRERVAEVAATRGLRGCSVRELLGPLPLRTLVSDDAQTRDVDTWADLDAAELRESR